MAESEKGGRKTTQGRGRGRGRGNGRVRSNTNRGGRAGRSDYSSPKSKRTAKDTSTTSLTKNGGISPTLPDSESQFPITYLSPPEPKLVPNVNQLDKETSTKEQTCTLMSSEKPPEENVPLSHAALQPDAISPQTFKEVVVGNIALPMCNTSHKSTFQLQKELYEDNTEEDTIVVPSFTTEYSNSVRMTMMFKLPTLKEGCVEEEAASFAIKKMNEMLKALTNKLPCRVGPWRMNNLAYGTPKTKTFLRNCR